MAKLTVDQKSIFQLFSELKTNFLIPNYQRPYAWEQNECQSLWDDVFDFAFPENGSGKFAPDSEYYLGPIVTFRNSEGKLEVIDGQQRLTTILLLLRAFYANFGLMQDSETLKTKERIEQCIWKTDEFDKPNVDLLKIDSEVATDNDKGEFLNILRTGVVDDNQKSRYAENYRFFLKKIFEFKINYADFFKYYPNRLMKNCILLPIEAENQQTALTIFSTLNNRGMPLSDSDIFKAQFYEHYKKLGKVDWFVDCWNDLTASCEKGLHPIYGSPLDALFTRYMYFERAHRPESVYTSTTEGVRDFFAKDKYALLKQDSTLRNLQDLAKFWEDAYTQNGDRFSNRILRKLFVLEYSPNKMWAYLTSVYFLKNRNSDNQLDEVEFGNFLDKVTAFVMIYSVVNPGLSAMRLPVYAEMRNIIEGKNVTFEKIKEKVANAEQTLRGFGFYNGRPITKMFLVWWALQQPYQQVLPTQDTQFDIEHIYPKNRQKFEHGLSNGTVLELLGNKAILEKRINIRASDYTFDAKRKWYAGFVTKNGGLKDKTMNAELLELAETLTDFNESEIHKRNAKILDSFLAFVRGVLPYV